MNEEEKKAVEDIKELKTLFEIDDKKDFEATPFVQKEIAKDLKVLLNIIDKMKNCINILDDELKERNKTINKKEIIIEKLQKENEELRQEREMVGLPVRNKRDGKIGIILHQWESGSIAVLENIKPRVINTHDSWNTLEIINDNVEQKRTENNFIPVQKVKDKIEEIQKEYNKLDKQIDEYINDVNKDLAKYYESKEKISIMQTLSCFIDILQELLEGRK